VRLRGYIAVVADAEGAISTYRFDARTRRGAERQARQWVTRTDWPATFIRIERPVQHPRATRGRRLLAIGGIRFVTAGFAISTLMIIGLSLEGAH
jgi:hypothetical protein